MVNSSSSRNRTPEAGKWRRDGEPPREVRVSFVVDPAKHPELASHLWALPYGSVGPYIRDVLLAHLGQNQPSPEDRLSAALQSLQEKEQAAAALVDRLNAAVVALEQVASRSSEAPAAPPVPAPPARVGQDQALSPAAMRFANTF